ncbi:MAG: hypothetical protein NVS9B6_14160 [Candidatus Limnocylindrales bacterium]
MLRAILGLRCPRCRRGRLFRGLITMEDACGVCGLVYEREHGYFVGAMAISYAIAIAVLGALFVLFAVALHWPLELSLLTAGALFLLAVPFVFRYSRSLWVHLDRRMDPDVPGPPRE